MNIVSTIVTLTICLSLGGCSRVEAVKPSEPTISVQQSAIPDTCPKDAKTLISWNAMNYGYKKSDDTIALMARILTSRGIEYRDRLKIKADIILLQEVNAGAKTGGAQAVARLAGALGQNWDYIISDATTGAGVERYATLWDKGSFIVDRREAHLVGDLADQVDREPYGVRLQWGDRSFWIYGYHAVPTAKYPIQEVKIVAGSPELARDDVILAGDFNIGRITIEGIFEGWQDHIDGKTSLKQRLGKNGEHRLYQYDHILTRGRIRVCDSGIIDFVETHYAPITDENLIIARAVSDHLPVYIRFTLDGPEAHIVSSDVNKKKPQLEGVGVLIYLRYFLIFGIFLYDQILVQVTKWQGTDPEKSGSGVQSTPLYSNTKAPIHMSWGFAI